MCKTLIALSIVSTMSIVPQAFAKGTTAKATTLYIRPHCIDAPNPDETMFGPIPDIDEMVSLGHDDCESFEVEDPQMLKTETMQLGDTLDIDIVAYNHDRQQINTVRAWLSYDPNVLEGVSVEVHENFPSVTPGESDFDAANGYVMVEASNDEEGANKKAVVTLARVQFNVIKTPPSGTYLLFHDVQPNGHTVITSSATGTEKYIIAQDPGGLHVIFQEAPLPPAAETSGEGGENSSSNTSSEESSTSPPGTVVVGGSCRNNTDCESNTCAAGICVPSDEKEPTEPEQEPSTSTDRTAFSLLQVNNLRVTCEGSSAYLAWDELNSSALKAYNIYYGTTSGRYIQRKTVEKTMDTLTLRSLPLEQTYYFAVRAVSTTDEESAFSQEVSVEICNPDTSTSPLIASAGGIANPLPDDFAEEEIPGGPVGIPSTIGILVLLCAIVGTLIASRRQWTVTTLPPRS